MDNIKEYIQNYFKQSVLSPCGSTISSKCYLRFDLGKGFENGTKKRVSQSVSRASKIFEEFFEPDDIIFIMINHCTYRNSDVKELWSGNDGYLENQIDDFSTLDILSNEMTVEEFDEALNENDELEMTDFTTTYIQRFVSQKVKMVNYKNIFEGIANLEMGFNPAINENIFFINQRNNVTLHMYDDRGCLLYASDCNTLESVYKKYNHWLVDDWRDVFDKYFL